MSDRFEELKNFVNSKMRMSHDYQPAMIIELLQREGSATTNQIARKLLSYDVSQIEYYEQVTTRMVGRVLTNNRGITEKHNRDYAVVGFEQLTSTEVDSLISSCRRKIEDFTRSRGKQPWSHRRKSSDPVSGTIRYEVLKQAKSRCELCGVEANVRALEVDHIVPRSKGGSNDKSNLQALCYSCNAMKRDRDDTDFRDVIESYGLRKSGCSYCDVPADSVISQNELCIATERKEPETGGRLFVAPKRHVSSYLDLFRPELNAIHSLISEVSLGRSDKGGKNFDVHFEASDGAEQVTSHCYAKLIPHEQLHAG